MDETSRIGVKSRNFLKSISHVIPLRSAVTWPWLRKADVTTHHGLPVTAPIHAEEHARSRTDAVDDVPGMHLQVAQCIQSDNPSTRARTSGRHAMHSGDRWPVRFARCQRGSGSPLPGPGSFTSRSEADDRTGSARTSGARGCHVAGAMTSDGVRLTRWEGQRSPTVSSGPTRARVTSLAHIKPAVFAPPRTAVSTDQMLEEVFEFYGRLFVGNSLAG